MYPFWFWNGEMEERELLRQLELFKDSGCAGVALHCRVGNKIDYMSERWLELCRFTSLRAKELGLKIWLYDEAGFPSGNAGEAIQKLRPDLFQKYMTFEYSGTDPQTPATHAFEPGSLRRINEQKVSAGTPALRFFLQENARHVDTFSRETCDLFIQLTHEKYKQALGDLWGDPIEAVYTDDESWLMCRFSGLPWSPVLEAEFRLKYNRELSDKLPLLVEDISGYERARMEYRSLAEEVFLRNFIQPQQDWCTANGLVYTGHLCGDEGPLDVMIDHLGAPMPYLKLEDIPAIDDFLCDLKDQRYLGQRTAGSAERFLSASVPVRSPLMLYKYGSSIAHQFSHDLLSCECLTFLLWDRTTDFFDLQMLFEIGMGVNLFTPHANYYTVGGVTKKDCPPSYFYQQPGFDRFGEMFATWTHAAELLLRGKFHGDLLLLLPARMWERQYGKDSIPTFVPQFPHEGLTVAQVEESLSIATFELMRRHIGFDYGDERIVAAEATLASGKLCVGNQCYSTILLPTGLTPLPEMMELLEKFRAAGGQIISADEMDVLDADIVLSGDGCEEILVHARDNGNFRELYLVNLSGRDLAPQLKISGRFKLYDPRTCRAIVCENTLPVGMVLLAGMACFVMPESFDCEVEPFELSCFAPAGKSVPATFVAAYPLNENIAIIGVDDKKEFILPENIKIERVYTEQLGDLALHVNGFALKGKSVPHHPADICYSGIDAGGFFRSGYNHIEGIERDFYLAGNFQIASMNPIVFTETQVKLGDLARQGYPCYWGKFEYQFTFSGKARFVDLDMIGSAEVWVNGKYAGTVFGAIQRIAVAAFCNDDANKLILRLANTPHNFICPSIVSFGITNCTVIR